VVADGSAFVALGLAELGFAVDLAAGSFVVLGFAAAEAFGDTPPTAALAGVTPLMTVASSINAGSMK
jgi:hypothetical protein